MWSLEQSLSMSRILSSVLGFLIAADFMIVESWLRGWEVVSNGAFLTLIYFDALNKQIEKIKVNWLAAKAHN